MRVKDAVRRVLVEARGPGSAEMRRVLNIAESSAFEKTGDAGNAWLEALARHLYGRGLPEVRG